MAVDITIPEMGESITEGEIVRWRKAAGEAVERDEVIVEIETDKATVELPAPESGVLSEILKGEGETVQVGETIARISTDGAVAEAPVQAPGDSPVIPSPSHSPPPTSALPLSPAVRRLVEEHDVNPAEVAATGRGGRLTKEDVLQHIETKTHEEPAQGQPHLRAVPGPSRTPALATSESAVGGQAPARVDTQVAQEARPSLISTGTNDDARERREPMSRIRRRIAERLLHAQHTAAILTTFNEIDMATVLALRSQYADAFKQRFDVSLGLLGFFAKACVEALRAFPAINAEIRGEDIVYKSYYDIGIAVATEQGLLVPVIRDVDRKSLAQIEKELGDLGQRAKVGKVSVEELTGGTFTISNGGVFGSLMSTPILNPPQSGILGMHKIEKRPVVIGPNDEIVVRSMMYVALSYDHRIVDGREAVLFLRRIKECIEDPNRLILGM